MATATDSTAAQGIIERMQNFVLEHKRLILVGTAAAIAAGGAAAYYASTSRHSSKTGGDVEKGEGKRKKGSKGKKKKSTKDKDGPILEERSPRVEDEIEEERPSDEQLAAMSHEERMKLAKDFKDKGNKVYGERNVARAEKYYTLAIEVSPKPEPVFYSNRAACYMNMNKYDSAIQDCDAALELDSKYIKALIRRASASEKLEQFQDAIRDYTTASILEKFQKQETVQSVERLIRDYSVSQAKLVLNNREKRLPSRSFISAYFAAFRPRPQPTLPESPSEGDLALQLALDALEAGDYTHALTLVNEAIDQGISWDAGKTEAFNLRGTFKFLMSDVEGAKNDLAESIRLEPSFVQSIVKLGSVYMEQGDAVKAFEYFEEAIKQNSKDPDIYYHRGQVLFIMNQFKEAADDYLKSTELDDKFVFSHIQLAVAYYKADQIAKSMATFRRTLREFPDRSEPLNYYGELLLDQGKPEEAIEKFDQAIEIEKLKTPQNVLPLVNKGLALIQWKQDFGAAERCVSEALRIDPECDSAANALSQLYLQQNKPQAAMELIEKQVELARTEPELLAALQYKYATSAQIDFARNYPHMMPELSAIARSI